MLHTKEIVLWDLGGRSPVHSLGEISWNLKKNHKHTQVLEFLAEQVSAERNKT